MKIYYVYIMLMLSAGFSCKKHEVPSIIIPDGTYKGTSGLSGALIYPGPPSSVTLIISGQNYSYLIPYQQSNSNGTFVISGQKVFFTPATNSVNGLTGFYNATIQNGNLSLTQTQNNITESIYVSGQ